MEKTIKMKMMKQMLLIAHVFFLIHMAVINSAHAEVLERIVVIVNDEIILLSEFNETFQAARESDSTLSGETVLNEMINTMVLLIEAKKYRIGSSPALPQNALNKESVISEYINRRIKAFIHIPHEDIENYYKGNRELFADKELYDVRDGIEDHLLQKELDGKLLEYIQELRRKAYIRVQL